MRIFTIASIAFVFGFLFVTLSGCASTFRGLKDDTQRNYGYSQNIIHSKPLNR